MLSQKVIMYIKTHQRRIAVSIAVFALLLLLPMIGLPGYFIHVLSWIFMYTVLAESFNIIAGIAGQFSLGHAMFFGLGAYTAAFLAIDGYPLIIAFLIGGCIAFIFAVPIGYVALKTRAIYFAMVTLAISESIKIIFLSRPELGGGKGVPLPLTYYGEGYYYYFFLIIFLVVVYATWFILNSKLGLALMSIRDDEVAAEISGVDITRYKVIAFSLSAFFPGLAGAIYAYYIGYVSPESVFTAMLSVSMQVQSILGGLGTVIGPVLGSMIMTVLGEWLLYGLPEIHLLIDGAIMATVMIAMPEGLLGLATRVLRMIRGHSSS